VVASHIMPVDSVVVEVVQNRQAVLGSTALQQFSVVGLGFANSGMQKSKNVTHRETVKAITTFEVVNAKLSANLATSLKCFS